MTVCKGACHKYRATKEFGQTRYASGQSRCTLCDIYIRWDGRHCPCCRRRLRKKPVNKYYKAMYAEKMEAGKK